MTEEKDKDMTELSTQHRELFTSWNALREYADNQMSKIQELKQTLEDQLQAEISVANDEAQKYMPILRALEQKKANVEAEMHDTDTPFPNMSLPAEDLTTAATNFLTDGTTDPITVNYTGSEIDETTTGVDGNNS